MTAARVPVAARRGWTSFAAWAVVGAIDALALIGIATIGVLVLPVALGATILLARRRSLLCGLPGVIAGLGVPPLYVGYLNRLGPGNVCIAVHAGQACVQEYSPWPWVASGLIFVVAGVALFVARSPAARHR